MADRPMIFSTPMIRALAREADAPGTGKTQTRRLLGTLKKFGAITEFGRSDTRGYDWTFRDRHMRWNDITNARLLEVLPYAVGDRLWVRETHQFRGADYGESSDPCEAIEWFRVYGAGGARDNWDPDFPADFEPTKNDRIRKLTEPGEQEGWGVVGFVTKRRPGIHMPRWASRATLTVTNVRVERLNDISEEDAIAEGARYFPDLPLHSLHRFPQNADRWSMEEPETTGDCLGSARMAFANFWLKLHGPTSWRDNPVVVAPTFTVALANIDSLPKSEAA